MSEETPPEPPASTAAITPSAPTAVDSIARGLLPSHLARIWVRYRGAYKDGDRLQCAVVLYEELLRMLAIVAVADAMSAARSTSSQKNHRDWLSKFKKPTWGALRQGPFAC